MGFRVWGLRTLGSVPLFDKPQVAMFGFGKGLACQMVYADGGGQSILSVCCKIPGSRVV